MKIENILCDLESRHPGEHEYLQAVSEVLESIEEVYNQHPEFENARLIERLVEPDRIYTFKIPWMDDAGKVHVNLGYRVQFNNAIGPYKGGLRFHPSVNLSTFKFWDLNKHLRMHLLHCQWGEVKEELIFLPKGKAIMKLCVSAKLLCWNFGEF